jgi:hypothetical protein
VIDAQRRALCANTLFHYGLVTKLNASRVDRARSACGNFEAQRRLANVALRKSIGVKPWPSSGSTYPEVFIVGDETTKRS